MKIVYCIQGMYKSGGIERVVTMKANYLAQHGYDVTIITTDQAGRPYFFAIDERVKRTDLGLDYGKLDYLPSYKRLWHTRLKRKEHKALLEQTLKHEQADFCVSVGFQDEDILPSLQDGSRKILEYHTSRSASILMYPPQQKLKRFLGYLRIKLRERLAAKYDCFVILTEVERTEWKGIPRIEVIPNANPLETTEQADVASSHKIIAAGRMEYVKNFLELVDIWAKVAPSHPDWHLSIYGDGWVYPFLKERIAQHGIEAQTILEGSSNDMASAYADSSIYVMTSHFEGLPMVLIEAQTMGLPVVSYACPSGPKDIIQDGVNGFLVSPYNQEAFAERLDKLISDTDLRVRMGEEGRRLSQRYTPEVIMSKWEKLFAQLTSSKKQQTQIIIEKGLSQACL